jgi:multiple sugar transport system permease protein
VAAEALPQAAQRRAGELPWRRWLSQFSIHLVLIAGALFMMAPFAWMLLTSVKTPAEARAFPPTGLPSEWRFDNFITAWQMVDWPRYFFNSALITLLTTLCVLVTASLAAYAFARMRFRGKDALFVVFLATMMIPGEVLLIPNFVIINQLGWYNTYAALVVPFATSVFAVFLLRQFFMTMPSELYDAAVIDGCGDFRFFRTIALPLARPALITVTLLTSLGTWNALVWPLIATSDKSMRVVQVGLQAFQNEAGQEIQLQMAASAFVMLPIVLLYVFLQRYFIETLASSGVKG